MCILSQLNTPSLDEMVCFTRVKSRFHGRDNRLGCSELAASGFSTLLSLVCSFSSLSHFLDDAAEDVQTSASGVTTTTLEKCVSVYAFVSERNRVYLVSVAIQSIVSFGDENTTTVSTFVAW